MSPPARRPLKKIKVRTMERYQYTKDQQLLLESIQTPFAVYQLIDKRVVTLVLSDGFCRLFGYTDRSQAYHDMDHAMYLDVHPDDAARIADAAFSFAKNGDTYEAIYRAKPKDTREYRVIHAHGRHFFTPEGIQLAQVSYTDEGPYMEEDESGRKSIHQALSNALHEESILKANYYDELTGLLNLSYFFELAETGKAAMRERGEEAVLLYMDLNGMKYYNHKYGFTEGDKLLRAFSKLLSKTFSNENCVHAGADRFAVFTKEAGLEETLVSLFEKAQTLNGNNSLPVRVGIYSTRMEDVPVSAAYDRAKISCDALKKTEYSSYNYYSKELSDYLKRSQYILENLDRAIEEKWIQVYYQPIVRSINEKACDVEALARWIDPTEGVLSPGDFIPFLENAGLIYKLDLYVLDQVLEKMKRVTGDGLYVIPHSINLSRSDFDACDIVEEIRKRVDAAGVSREKISVEITESVIGSDFDFMKEQVARFQKLGFPVWMDDFGSGYSSLDVLQSIQFNLLKFDMSFMRKLDEGESGKIILTELMKMATALGVDTISEGVETAEQVRFLQEIGCSKLQGYYYSKPVSYQEVLDRRKSGHPLLPENPDESAYYDSIGRVNLYDLSVIANTDENMFHNAFNTLPMGVIEIKDDTTRFVRSNQSYRDFIKRFFGMDLSQHESAFQKIHDSFMYNVVRTCCIQGVRSFYDEKMPDGSVVHSFARKIGMNPVTGTTAVVIAVLSVSDPDEATTYSDIARALAADYYNIYVVDLGTDQYIEYTSPVGEQEMAMERHGQDFFAVARRNASTRIYEEDQDSFLSVFTKEKVLRALDTQGMFTATYRMMDTGKPTYATAKITRMQPQGNRIIVGISIVEAQMEQKKAEKRAREQSLAFGRIAALSGKYYALYIIDPETGKYSEYNVTSDYSGLGYDQKGENFFTKARSDGQKVVYFEDLPFFLEHLTKENIMRRIHEKGLYQIQYRLVINGEPKPIVLKAAMVKESDGDKIIVGVTIVDG